LTFYLIILYYITNRFHFFFFNHPATTEIYTLSLHDALPISDNREVPVHVGRAPEDLFHPSHVAVGVLHRRAFRPAHDDQEEAAIDRKSTRLNSSHDQISYAVFCLKKKKKITLKTDCCKHTTR